MSRIARFTNWNIAIWISTFHMAFCRHPGRNGRLLRDPAFPVLLPLLANAVIQARPRRGCPHRPAGVWCAPFGGNVTENTWIT